VIKPWRSERDAFRVFVWVRVVFAVFVVVLEIARAIF
jgi:hypothetical protein